MDFKFNPIEKIWPMDLLQPHQLCDCTSDYTISLVKQLQGCKDIPQFVRERVSKHAEGMIDVILHRPDYLSEPGKELIKQCLNFLILWRLDDLKFPKKDQTGFHKNKFIAPITFISGFLGITSPGFDGYLLNYLRFYGYTCHGGSLGGSWIDLEENHDDYFTRYINDLSYNPEKLEQFKQNVHKWAESASDDIGD